MCPPRNYNSKSDRLITTPSHTNSLCVMKWGKSARVRSGWHDLLRKMLGQALRTILLKVHFRDLRQPGLLYNCCLQLSSVLGMHCSSWIPTILVLLCGAVSTVSTVHNGYEPHSKLPRAPSLPRRNSTKLPSLLKYDSCPSCMQGMPLIYML